MIVHFLGSRKLISHKKQRYIMTWNEWHWDLSPVDHTHTHTCIYASLNAFMYACALSCVFCTGAKVLAFENVTCFNVDCAAIVFADRNVGPHVLRDLHVSRTRKYMMRCDLKKDL